MYTETFTFFLGHFCLDSFVFPPFIFNSFYQVGTTVCRSCGCVTTNIWEKSGSWTGVGWELGVLASTHTTNLPPHSPPQIPLAPQSLAAPRALIPHRYLGPILRISWAYIDHVFALYIGPVIFSEHFNTLSQLVHHTQHFDYTSQTVI